MYAKLASAFAMTALLATASLATPVGPNLLVNGSFESGPGGSYAEIGGGSSALAGWTTALSGVEYFSPSAYGLGLAQDGSYIIDLDNYVYTGGGIEQTFATVAGQSYQVDFWGSTDQTSGRDGTGTLDLSVDGSAAGSFQLVNHTVPLVWQEFTFDFTATGSSTTLRFSSMDDPLLHFANLDNVVVGLSPEASPASVPEPSAAWLLPIGLISLAFVRRRHP